MVAGQSLIARFAVPTLLAATLGVSGGVGDAMAQQPDATNPPGTASASHRFPISATLVAIKRAKDQLCAMGSLTAPIS